MTLNQIARLGFTAFSKAQHKAESWKALIYLLGNKELTPSWTEKRAEVIPD